MDHRYLGATGFQVSSLTLGNWLTHGSQVDADRAAACVRAAVESGITAFDTADSYANGAAETVLGEALRGCRRESLQLSTKVYFPVGPEPWGKNDTGLSRKHILEGIDGSLRRLGVDYMDVYYAHRWDPFTPLEETMQAFADVVRSGKALYIGVSEWTADQLREGQALARKLGFRIIANQAQYSALWRVIEGRVIPAGDELGVSQVIWSPLAQGVLTGKYLPGNAAPAGSRAADESGSRMIQTWMRDEVLAAVQTLRPIAADAGLTLSQLALAWALAHPSVASAVIGASRPEQVAENVAAVSVPLDSGIRDRIDAALQSVVTLDPERTADFTPKSRAV